MVDGGVTSPPRWLKMVGELHRYHQHQYAVFSRRVGTGEIKGIKKPEPDCDFGCFKTTDLSLAKTKQVTVLKFFVVTFQLGHLSRHQSLYLS
jgi:hypothetical protein